MPDTITFLFADIEGSTGLWEAQPARMAAVLARHDALCREVVGGSRRPRRKDHRRRSVCRVRRCFRSDVGRDRAAARHSSARPRIRARAEDPLRPAQRSSRGTGRRLLWVAVNCAARVMDAAHGGQVLVTQALVSSLRRALPEGADLLHLGRVRLRGVSSPIDVWQVRHADLRRTFPPLRTLESIPHNLPRHATSFIGRENQIGEVIAHLRLDEPADADRRRRLREVAARVAGGDQPGRVVLQTAHGSLSSRRWPIPRWCRTRLQTCSALRGRRA